MINSKEKYVILDGKLYCIENISFFHMSISLVPCNMSVNDIPENEIFPLQDLKVEFSICIKNK